MRVFVAGASGVVGRSLVRQLVAAGHEVTGTTRREERMEEIRAAGASPVRCNVLPGDEAKALHRAEPEVVINQLTSLPREYNPRKASFYAETDRVRREGGHNLVEAARAAGARRLEREGQARAGLAAQLPELARRLPGSRGTRLGSARVGH